MANINIIQADGPIVFVTLHLNTAYIIVREEQPNLINKDTVEFIIEGFNTTDTGVQIKGQSFSINKYTLDVKSILAKKDPDEFSPEYMIKIPIDNKFYVLTVRAVGTVGLTDTETSPGIYSKNTIVHINNFFTWVYPERFIDLFKDDVQHIFENRKTNSITVFGNIPPIGGIKDDIQILSPGSAYTQQFKFNDFSLGSIFSASWDSNAVATMFSIDIQDNAIQKYIVPQEMRKFIIGLVSTPGLNTVLLEKSAQNGSVFEANIDILNSGTSVPPDFFVSYSKDQYTELGFFNDYTVDHSALHLTICFTINDIPYSIQFIGDFSFVSEFYI